jgi:hypothetical protein
MTKNIKLASLNRCRNSIHNYINKNYRKTSKRQNDVMILRNWDDMT